ncbi:MAG: PepSY domain-containing protein [Gammaproteobacteria bacterium]
MKTLLSICLVLLSGWQGITLADDDHDIALQLREQGKIMSLKDILSTTLHSEDERVIEVELKGKDDKYFYEVLVIDGERQLWEIYIDAQTGDVLHKEPED